MRGRVEHGDWQTPDDLARAVVRRLACNGFSPRAIVEPTCGAGAFLEAAMAWPEALRLGFELQPEYVRRARARLGVGARIEQANFFDTDWVEVLGALPEPLLVLGNPPWVTNAALGALGGTNLPDKHNDRGLSGLDARTGKSNFDVSEWMILRLVRALSGRRFALAMLCKAIVARRVMEAAALEGWPVEGEVRGVDARAHFAADVDAVLLTVRSRGRAPEVLRWPRYPSLGASAPEGSLGVIDGVASPDVDALARTRHLEGECAPVWRSGVKHDCAQVMELDRVGEGLESRLSGPVALEPERVFPLLKGADVANGRWPPRRVMLVPQSGLGEDTSTLEDAAPKTWAYLRTHAERLAARRSSIYRGQPDFAVFGVGPYTFAPWKVAIAGLYKRLRFEVVPPHEGRPVVFDDTTYFLPFDGEAEARAAHAALISPRAIEFFSARIFWEDKRPITKRVLQSLDLARLIAEPGARSTPPGGR